MKTFRACSESAAIITVLFIASWHLIGYDLYIDVLLMAFGLFPQMYPV